MVILIKYTELNSVPIFWGTREILDWAESPGLVETGHALSLQSDLKTVITVPLPALRKV